MMDDATITRLCAEAVEPMPKLPGASDVWGVTIQFAPIYKLKAWVRSSYNPLHDDAQCFALVKKFNLDIAFDGAWNVVMRRDTVLKSGVFHYPDLNKAVCECVARMQQAKGEK